MRVANRMDPGYDGRASAGYRDVALNLRVGSEAAARLGVERHVCEVQLILRQFAELKARARASVFVCVCVRERERERETVRRDQSA